MKCQAEVDHIFLFVSGEARAREMMEAARLRVNYSRAHSGQGTRNLCACLDDVFIELLWLDGSEILPESERITLGQRGRGQGSPVGISWRGHSCFDCVQYAAPFLPKNMEIPVARMSLDPSLPFVFAAPKSKKLTDPGDVLADKRQLPHFTILHDCEIRCACPGRLEALIVPFNNISTVVGTDSIRFKLGNLTGEITHDFVWASDL